MPVPAAAPAVLVAPVPVATLDVAPAPVVIGAPEHIATPVVVAAAEETAEATTLLVTGLYWCHFHGWTKTPHTIKREEGDFEAPGIGILINPGGTGRRVGDGRRITSPPRKPTHPPRRLIHHCLLRRTVTATADRRPAPGTLPPLDSQSVEVLNIGGGGGAFFSLDEGKSSRI